jgi:hypothetical protein
VLGQRNHQIIVTLAQDRQQAQLSLELTEYTELFQLRSMVCNWLMAGCKRAFPACTVNQRIDFQMRSLLFERGKTEKSAGHPMMAQFDDQTRRTWFRSMESFSISLMQ